jgi:hypothetical protein
MDSDDEISPDCIDKLYAKMQEENVDFVEGVCQNLHRSGEIIGYFIYTYWPKFERSFGNSATIL